MTALAPAATQSWQIDAAHSAVSFAVRHMVFATARGGFGEIAGTIALTDDDPSSVTVDVTIGTASIDTRSAKRDEHLRSSDFFDVAAFPVATYSARGARANAGGTWALDGALTIRGISRPVVLTVTPLGGGTDPWGTAKRGWSATATIDRREFGLGWNQALETGGVLVANEVELTLDIQAAPTA